jgi:hypothetical protein
MHVRPSLFVGGLYCNTRGVRTYNLYNAIAFLSSERPQEFLLFCHLDQACYALVCSHRSCEEIKIVFVEVFVISMHASQSTSMVVSLGQGFPRSSFPHAFLSLWGHIKHMPCPPLYTRHQSAGVERPGFCASVLSYRRKRKFLFCFLKAR